MEGKVRRSTKSVKLGEARVMSFEDLENAKAEHAAKEAAKEAKKVKREAEKAAREAKEVASAMSGVGEATADKKSTRDQKRKSPASTPDAPEPNAKVARMSDGQVQRQRQSQRPQWHG